MLSIIQTTPESSIAVTNRHALTLSPAQQIRAAFRADPVGQMLGISFGAFIPICSWFYCHRELTGIPMQSDARWLIVLAALIFSGISVARWGAVAFSSGGSVTFIGSVKALAFTALAESVMLTAHAWELSIAALVILVTVNMVSCVTAFQAVPDTDSPVTNTAVPAPVTINVANVQNVTRIKKPPMSAAERARAYRARKKQARECLQTQTQ